jgi:hydroxymethylpyrimidine kinase/phosphomethylpyrimidine kinase
MQHAARAIARRGAANVLVKGGALTDQCVDVLLENDNLHAFVADRLSTGSTHGTGCVLSAAIVARLARGEPVTTAVEQAKAFVTRAIQASPGLGEGIGPVNLFAPIAD